MRVIVYGAGAIGGTVAAALFHSGQEVVAIARGAQLDAIRAGGLRLRAPDLDVTVPVACVSDPAEIAFRPDDAILLVMKSQDTLPALSALQAAGVQDQPVFCLQNGVANERMALRRFPNVHGVTVMMPARFVQPGEVAVFSDPRFGIFDIGRYPTGTDTADTALAKALEAAGFAAFVTPEVMASKYGKLLMNLLNVVQAALGPKADRGDLPDRVRAEAETVYRAAGIAWLDVGLDDPRRADLMRSKPVAGVERVGGSTLQSLLRGLGSVETDYLNGEIALLGRLHGVPAPLNTGLAALGADLARHGARPGTMSLEEVETFLAGHMPQG